MLYEELTVHARIQRGRQGVRTLRPRKLQSFGSLAILVWISLKTTIYTRGLWKRITIFFALFLQTVYAIEKLLTGFNVQPRIGMNLSFIWLHYHAMLLMTSHGYIQHPAPFCTNEWSFLIIFMFKLWRIWCHVTKRVYRLFLIKSNW